MRKYRNKQIIQLSTYRLTRTNGVEYLRIVHGTQKQMSRKQMVKYE